MVSIGPSVGVHLAGWKGDPAHRWPGRQIIAVLDGQAVGHVEFYLHSDNLALQVVGVQVHPGFRKRGLASLLMDRLYEAHPCLRGHDPGPALPGRPAPSPATHLSYQTEPPAGSEDDLPQHRAGFTYVDYTDPGDIPLALTACAGGAAVPSRPCTTSRSTSRSRPR